MEEARRSDIVIDEAALSARLYTAGMPDPDLLIRTSGEMRVSNFLLWQIAYAELYVTQTLWPDFSRIPNARRPAIRYLELKPEKTTTIGLRLLSDDDVTARSYSRRRKKLMPIWNRISGVGVFERAASRND